MAENLVSEIKKQTDDLTGFLIRFFASKKDDKKAIEKLGIALSALGLILAVVESKDNNDEIYERLNEIRKYVRLLE